jgi:hypothetical protein
MKLGSQNQVESSAVGVGSIDHTIQRVLFVSASYLKSLTVSSLSVQSSRGVLTVSDDADHEIYDLLREDADLWPDRAIRSSGYWIDHRSLSSHSRDFDQPSVSGEGFGFRVVCGTRAG